MSKVRFRRTITPRQGSGPRVVSFAATAGEIFSVARIARIARDDDGGLSGFQRPAIHSHIREIGEYLAQEGSVLPNAVVVAFASGATVDARGSLEIDVTSGPPGWVVDGQQRLTAAKDYGRPDFELLVSAFLCSDLAELNRQFILVNNVRPLPKQLIYELLPTVDGLPHRLGDRSGAALLTSELNYRRGSTLRGLIHQHTHPEGLIRDTLVQRMLMNSMGQGALRDMALGELLDEGFRLTSEFFGAVQDVFPEDWHHHSPKTSRLVHGVGITGMGFVMDELVSGFGMARRPEFREGLRPLVGRTHWREGEWSFGEQVRPWNTLQNTKADYQLVSHYLVRVVRNAARSRRRLAEAAE